LPWFLPALLLWVAAGAIFYAAAFLVTMLLNVPLNEQLAAAGQPDQISDLAAIRDAFEGPWVDWNLLRTLLTLGSLTALSIALLRHHRVVRNQKCYSTAQF
jgi:uncharacterized membrane protein